MKRSKYAEVLRYAALPFTLPLVAVVVVVFLFASDETLQPTRKF